MPTSSMSKKALTDQASDLVEQVTPHVEAARERLVNDYLPMAQEVLADARDAAMEVAKSTRDLTVEAAMTAEKSTRKSRREAAKAARARTHKLMVAAAAAAPVAAPLADKVADRIEPKPKRGKRVLLLLVLAGVGAFVARKVRGGTSSSTTSYQPPRPAPAHSGGSATSASMPVASTPPAGPADTIQPDAPADEGGAFLDEALADAVEEPHKVTTPDQPLEVTEVDGGPASTKS
jgi:hypothetical protein